MLGMSVVGRSRRYRRLRQPWRWVPFWMRLRVAQVRNWLGRHRVLRAALRVAAVVTIVSVLVGSSLRSRAAQQRWGETTSVVVVDQQVAIGDRAQDVSFSIERRPAAFVPADALSTMPADDDVLVAELLKGDIATERDLRSTRPSLALGDGRRAVSVPLDSSVPPLAAGDHLDLFLVEEAFGTVSGGARQLRSVAVVLEVGEEAATLSVDEADVQALADVAIDGTVILALR